MGFFGIPWPWEWGQQVATQVATNSMEMLITALVFLVVGAGLAIIGLLFLIGKLPAPFGPGGRFVIGMALVGIGALVALGVL